MLILGLILNAIGAIVLLFFPPSGWPKPLYTKDGGIPFMFCSNNFSEEEKEKNKAKLKKTMFLYRYGYRLGVILLIAGFILQTIGVLIKK